MSYTPCRGTSALIGRNRKIIYTYESADGNHHEFVNCPVCQKELKCGNTDFVPRHRELVWDDNRS